jgi:hypothetical protein
MTAMPAPDLCPNIDVPLRVDLCTVPNVLPEEGLHSALDALMRRYAPLYYEDGISLPHTPPASTMAWRQVPDHSRGTVLVIVRIMRDSSPIETTVAAPIINGTWCLESARRMALAAIFACY